MFAQNLQRDGFGAVGEASGAKDEEVVRSGEMEQAGQQLKLELME
jgi:hypothetical protein